MSRPCVYASAYHPSLSMNFVSLLVVVSGTIIPTSHASYNPVAEILQSYRRESTYVSNLLDVIQGLALTGDSYPESEDAVMEIVASGELHGYKLLVGLCAMVPRANMLRMFARIHAVVADRWIEQMEALETTYSDELDAITAIDVTSFVNDIYIPNLTWLVDYRDSIKWVYQIPDNVSFYIREDDAAVTEVMRILEPLADLRSGEDYEKIFDKLRLFVSNQYGDKRKILQILKIAHERMVTNGFDLVSRSLNLERDQKLDMLYKVQAALARMHAHSKAKIAQLEQD